MKKYALALDLINDADLIREYENYHQQPPMEVSRSIVASGIFKMEIYRVSNRLFMLMETDDDFSFTRKKKMDDNNSEVQEWEKLMWKFQQPMPWAAEGEKWVLMNKIYDLEDQVNAT